MADSTKVRLVRCPKCENLLPELENYSVYQCGGCGAVLRAKNRNRDTDTVSQKSDEPQITRDTGGSRNPLEKGVVELSDTSDVDIKSNTGSLSCDEKNLDKIDIEDDDDTYKNQANANGKWVVENALDRENGNLNSEKRHTSKSWRSGQMSDWDSGEKAELLEGFQRATKSKVEGVRFSTSNEGASSYNLDSSYSSAEPMRNHLDNNSELHLEKDRAELLRKLDELKEQLSRSCDVADNKSKEKAPLNGRMPMQMPPLDPYSSSDSWFPSSSSMPDRASMQYNRAPRPPYMHHYPDPFEMGMHNSNHIPGFGVRRGLHQLSGPSRQYFSRNYFDGNSDPYPYTSYPSNMAFHQPSCSCFHCYQRHHGVHPPVPVNPMLYQHENPREIEPFDRWPSDINSDMGGFVRSRPRRVFLASGGRSYRPAANGAPFMTCSNCFELLELPKKVLLKGKTQKRVQCGSCSAIISFSLVNKKLVFSSEVAQVLADVDDSSRTSYPHVFMSRLNANFSSEDYDNSCYDFQTVDPDPIGLKHQEMNSFHTSSLSTTDDENSPDALIQPIKDSALSPPAGSPLQQHFNYSGIDRDDGVNRFGKGNRSSRSEQEKVMGNKATTRQNSMKEVSQATEIEVPFHEYSNTGVSQESGDANKEDSQLKTGKGGESFFANIIKKSFKDFSRSNQTDERGRSNVSVNGHFIPDRLVKKAEKVAGPIHPGQYWYDFRAGFWGVVGGPCLGIIPPYIEEFNYAMPENCAGGTTGVYVNGRELHPKDLDLLASRGLPVDRDRSYIVEINGKVVDEDTGEELDSLGKLAPTVEKVKHGFGMKAPKAAG